MGITAISSFPKRQVSLGSKAWTKPSFSTMSTIVQEQQDNNSSDQVVQEEKAEEVESIDCQLSRPRFSMFGKKAKFTELNNRCLEEDTQVIETAKKPSAKQKTVRFHPVYLERVCLFTNDQSPCELKEAHDKQLLNPSLRIICSHWPTSDRLILNKKSFTLSSDNSSIYGEVMIPNLALDKSVLVRYTLDSWATSTDVDASFFGPYLKKTSYDTYEFTLNLDHQQLADRGEIRGKVEFCVRYTIGTIDYWANNDGKHYQIKIVCDTLNNPWNVSDEELFQDIEESHEQFQSALKDYQPARPYHKQKPWIKTRYDFAESLQLAKLSSTTTISRSPIIFQADLSFIKEEAQQSPMYQTITPPSSPKASPVLTSSAIPSAIPLEFNSTLYLHLLKKYCFHTSDHLL